ncbi:MAG: hypothetical protein KDD58_02375 [Bdellovibrionales bacterium]|nr:hypothetical protein [Bdellovibrionales bacterium]
MKAIRFHKAIIKDLENISLEIKIRNAELLDLIANGKNLGLYIQIKVA